MGYGFGVFLMAVGLILALAVRDAIDGVELVTIGWILTAAGVVVLVLTAVTLNRRRESSVRTTRHADGTVTERRADDGPPPAV